MFPSSSDDDSSLLRDDANKGKSFVDVTKSFFNVIKRFSVKGTHDGTSPTDLTQALCYLDEAQQQSMRQKRKISNLQMRSLEQMNEIKNLETKLSQARTRVSDLESEVKSLRRDREDVADEQPEEPSPDVDISSDESDEMSMVSIQYDSDLNDFKGGEVAEASNAKTIREMAGNFIEAHATRKFVVLIITVNCITMGIATFDFVAEPKNNPVSNAFDVMDRIFLIIYTIELVLHFIHKRLRMFNDGWITFDFLVVSLSWFSEAVDGADIEIIRGFRALRILQLIPKVKIMKGLVSALISTIPRMFATTGLLALVLYIFGVLFTSLFSEMCEKPEVWGDSACYFRRLDHTIFTLIQIMTMDNWTDIFYDLMKYSSSAWIFLYSYIFIADAIFLNLIIAIICDAIPLLSATENDEEEEDPHHPFLKAVKRKEAKYEEELKELYELLYNQTLRQEKTMADLRLITSQLDKYKRENHLKKDVPKHKKNVMWLEDQDTSHSTVKSRSSSVYFDSIEHESLIFKEKD